MKTLTSFTPLALVLLSISCCLSSCGGSRGEVEYGEGGKIIRGRGKAHCEKPRKPYAKEIEATLKAVLNDSTDLNVDASLKSKIVKLTDYSQQGLDRDLLLFRICEMSINRGFTDEQTVKLIEKVTEIWQEEINARETKNH